MKNKLIKTMLLLIITILSSNIFAQTVQITHPDSNGQPGFCFLTHCSGLIQGGTAPYTSNMIGVSLSGNSIFRIPITTTIITITDVNGNSLTTDVTSSMAQWAQNCSPPKCEILAIDKGNVTSFGGNDGWIRPAFQWITQGCENTQKIVDYTIYKNNVPISTKPITQVTMGLNAGSYEIQFFSSCAQLQGNFSRFITITEPIFTPLTATSTILSPAKCSAANGSAKVNATGGTGAYTYLWSNGATTATVNNLLGSTPYTCQVTSGTATQNITVIVPKTNTPIMPTIKSKAGTGKNLNNTVEVWINGAPVTGPNYTFLWSTGATTPTIVLPAKMAIRNTPHVDVVGYDLNGNPIISQTPVVTTPNPNPKTTYTVTVTDAFGCTGTATLLY
jgi:SprB repeat